jgi:hypothetical protein
LLTNSFSLNEKLITNDKILYSKETAGKAYDSMYIDYCDLIERIDNLNLDSLKDKKFIKENGKWIYKDLNYKYEIKDDVLNVYEDEVRVFHKLINGTLTMISYNKDVMFDLSYEAGNINLNFNEERIYSLLGKDRLVLSGYEYSLSNDYKVINEVYDQDFNFKSIGLVNKYDVNYEAYFIEDLGYELSEDRAYIYNEDESVLSTKYMDDGETIYYTLGVYVFPNGIKKDLFIIKNKENFPF